MTSINWDFISSLEGKGVKKAYVPSENSGVTVATGFDLKEKDTQILSDMGISQETTSLLSQFFGMSGAEAKSASENFSLNDEQVKEIDQASHSWYANQVKKTYESKEHKTAWDQLTEAERTVIASVGFQHGTSFTRKDGSEMNYIKQAREGDWESLEANLRNFGDDFNTRRNKEADFLAAEKKTLDEKFIPTDITKQKFLYSELPDVSRGLFLDKAYNYSQLQEHIAEGRTISAALKASLVENTIFSNAYELFTSPTFVQEDGFSMKNNKEEFDAVIKQYNLNPDFADSLIGALNGEHLKYLGEKAARHQKNAELLASYGWGGIALQFGTFILDPVNLTGYGALAKVMKGTQFFTGLTRRQNFVRKGLAYGSMEGALYAPIAANNPTMGLDDVLIASALGGTLGGGISALTAKNLRNIASATQRIDLVDNGLTPSKEADQTVFKNVKHSLKNKKLIKDLDDTALVDNVEIFFPKLRNVPAAFGLWSMNRSGTLGSSLSKKVKLFGFKSLEDPVGYKDTVKSGKGIFGKKVAATQDSTVEMTRDQVVMQAHNTIYGNVGDAMKGYLKERGVGGVRGFFQFGLKTQFMHDTKRVIVALGKQEKKQILTEAETVLLKDTNLVKSANAYADGFQLWAKLLREAGVEGAEDLAQNTGRYYVPRKISFESFAALEKRIGEPGVEDLLTQAISKEQPLLNRVDNPAAARTDKDIKGDVSKARALARVIVKAAKYNNRQGGFDIEQLIRIKDPAKLKEYIDDVFVDLSQSQKDDLFTGLQNQISLLTSGRFKQRIRLDENFETVVNGQRVRLDEIFENDVDLLWHSYTNEMSGWYSLADRLGIKSRNAWLKYSNELKRDIDDVYRNPNEAEFKRLKNKFQRRDAGAFVAKEEKDTIDSFFNNLMGRSTETGDPTVGLNKILRDLRRFNFVRVLNQVGVAQLPEYGVAVSQQGFRTLINEIPFFRKLVDDAQNGKMSDTFYKDMAVIGSSNGDDYIYRQFQAYDVLDRGVSQLDSTNQKAKLMSKPVQNAFEKGTGHASGLIGIDRNQRRIAMRLFVHRLAEDLIDVSKKGTMLKEISKGRLNRYRVLGLTDNDLVALAKEFNSPKVVTTKNALGRRVLSFDFVNFKDQALVKKFGIAVNRYTKRAVQYNMIGDTQRYMSDAALGKSMSQFRQFIMTAWSKQFLHNVAMGDFQTFAMFAYTMFIGGSAYIAQAHFNTIGMSATEKKAYLKKKLGETGTYNKVAMASFQRAGWSSVMPPFMDFITGYIAPEYRFNTRSSGQEMNLITGNPTYDLGEKVIGIFGSVLKSTANSNYNFSKQDLNRIMRILPYQNLYGINQTINFIRDNSGLPDKGQKELY